MLSYQFYKVLHIVGILLLFLSLGGGLISALTEAAPGKKRYAASHGVALLLILVGGFGLMARLGIPHTAWPNWIIAKFSIWLLFGASIALVKRKRDWNLALWWGLVALGGLSAFFAIYKPGT